MAVFVSVSILIFALSEESTPVLQPAMSFSLVLLLDAVLSKGIRGLNFVVYVLGGQWKPDQQFKPGTYRSGVQFVRIVSSVAHFRYKSSDKREATKKGAEAPFLRRLCRRIS